MSFSINTVTVVQGTGTYVKESVLEVSYTLVADNEHATDTFDAEAQFTQVAIELIR